MTNVISDKIKKGILVISTQFRIREEKKDFVF